MNIGDVPLVVSELHSGFPITQLTPTFPFKMVRYLDFNTLARLFTHYVNGELQHATAYDPGIQAAYGKLLALTDLEEIHPQCGDTLNLELHQICEEETSDVQRRRITHIISQDFPQGNQIVSKAKLVIG